MKLKVEDITARDTINNLERPTGFRKPLSVENFATIYWS